MYWIIKPTLHIGLTNFKTSDTSDLWFLRKAGSNILLQKEQDKKKTKQTHWSRTQTLVLQLNILMLEL